MMKIILIKKLKKLGIVMVNSQPEGEKPMFFSIFNFVENNNELDFLFLIIKRNYIY